MKRRKKIAFCTSSVRSGDKRLPVKSSFFSSSKLFVFSIFLLKITSPHFIFPIILHFCGALCPICTAACHLFLHVCFIFYFCSHSLYVCMLSGKSLDNSLLKAQSSTSSQPDSSQGSSAALYCKSPMARQMQPATHIHTHINMLCQQFTLNTFFLV